MSCMNTPMWTTMLSGLGMQQSAMHNATIQKTTFIQIFQKNMYRSLVHALNQGYYGCQNTCISALETFIDGKHNNQFDNFNAEKSRVSSLSRARGGGGAGGEGFSPATFLERVTEKKLSFQPPPPPPPPALSK